MDKTISFLEDEDIIKMLDELADKRGTDRSALIREGIRMVLEKEAKR